MSKIVFFDIDDTLIHHKRNRSYIPESTIEALKKLKDKGHEIGIASGRGSFQMKQIVEYLDIGKIVGFNGHELISEGELLERNPLHKGDMDRLIKRLNDGNKPFILAGEDSMYLKDFMGIIKKSFFDRINPIEKVEPSDYKMEMKSFNYDSDSAKDFYSLMIISSSFNDYEQYENLNFKSWGKRGYEITNKGMSKLSGIIDMANHLGYSMDDIVVFGDNYNDIEMLAGIKNSVAMGNAVDDAKNVASFVTKHIEDDGIMHACKHFELI